MKLSIETLCCVSVETYERNAALSKGWPEPKGSGPLAIVGGGPSLREHFVTLRTWPGDIWAINGAWRYCFEQMRIVATFYSVDPEPCLADYMRGAARAVLAEQCDPAAFAMPCEIYRCSGNSPGPTSVTASTLIAIEAGYSSVTYFGCESSYHGRTHAYEDTPDPLLLKIECGGQEFFTKPDLILQAQVLSKIILAAPSVYSERSGGLLRAMIEHGTEFEALAGTKHFHDTMRITDEPARKEAAP